jgi:DNA-binding transcriptional MerR regulator
LAGTDTATVDSSTIHNVRIAELSSRSGTSIPTIKYYLREGLLPPGTPTGRNQADYGEEHVRRLRLIRALIDVGGLSVAAARDVLATVDETEVPDHRLLGVASYALTRAPRRDRTDPAWRAAREEVAAVVRAQGWHVMAESPNLDQLADGVTALRELGQEDLLATLPTYFRTAEQIAQAEVETVVRRAEPARMVEGVVVGTIIGEVIIDAIRRLAHEHVSALTLGVPPGT